MKKTSSFCFIRKSLSLGKSHPLNFLMQKAASPKKKGGFFML